MRNPLSKFSFYILLFLSMAFTISACSHLRGHKKQNQISLPDNGHGCNIVIQEPYKVFGLGSDSVQVKWSSIDTLSKPGPLHLFFKLNHIEMGSNKTEINESKEVVVDKETEIIKFKDSFGFRFFHLKGSEYESIKHYLKYDFLIFRNRYWVLLTSSNYDEISNTSSNYNSSATFTEDNAMIWSFEIEYRVLNP